MLINCSKFRSISIHFYFICFLCVLGVFTRRSNYNYSPLFLHVTVLSIASFQTVVLPRGVNGYMDTDSMIPVPTPFDKYNTHARPVPLWIPAGIEVSFLIFFEEEFFNLFIFWYK